MSALSPTPRELMLDRQGRPYFLWDVDMTLERFLELLRSGTAEQRSYLIGKLMRQAKPDDVFQFVTLAEIRSEWDAVQKYLGTSRAMWSWLLDSWKEPGAVG